MARNEGISSVGSMVLAFLGSQHHTVHMLLLAGGVGSAGVGILTNAYVRAFMLTMSVGMAGWTLNMVLRKNQPMVMRALGALSAAVTLGLVILSLVKGAPAGH